MLIEGERALLRTPAAADLAYLRKLWADPETMKEVGGPFEISEDKARRWFEKMVDPGSARDRFFLICDKQSGEPVGEASFHRYDPAERSAELNIKVEGKRRFGGHGFEALVLLLDYYFNSFGGGVMIDPLAPANVSGQRAMARFGFARAGATEEAVIYQLERERFNQLYRKGHP
ncbi:MAG TPA: GNAT family N-acetyltransferase [Candidatus Edwardsbacteria bacterium]|nr:GNAT family N-acetyltransferase [Candidatus Edwardsbacteria bacterium]